MKYNILYLFVIIIAIQTQSVVDSTDLQLVIEVFRHGARYPIFDNTFGPLDKTKIGELTPVGMRLHHMLGKALRQDYILNQKFLSESYSHNEMYIQSTDFNRTIMSAQSQLLGLYPLGTGPQKFANITQMDRFDPPFQDKVPQIDSEYSLLKGQQPFAIHMNTKKDDQLLQTNFDGCPQAQKWNDEYQDNKDLKQLMKDNSQILNELISFVQQNYGKTITLDQLDANTYNSYFDTLISLKFQNEQSPNQLPQQTFDDLYFLYNQVIQMTYYYKDDQRKLVSTKILQAIQQYIQDNIDKKKTFKWYMISAHDINILSLMNAFGQTSWECLQKAKNNKLGPNDICVQQYPDYASTYILELRRDKTDNTKYYVMTKYNGNYIDILKKGQQAITLDDFNSHIKNYVVSDFEKQCLFSADQSNEETYVPGWSISIMVIFGILLLGVLLYSFYYWKNNKQIFAQYEDYEAAKN